MVVSTCSLAFFEDPRDVGETWAFWSTCKACMHLLVTQKVQSKRETAKAEDMMRAAVVAAQGHFDKMYK